MSNDEFTKAAEQARKMAQERDAEQARQKRERARQQKEAESKEKESAIRARRVENLEKHARPALDRKRAGRKAKEEEARLRKDRAKSLADQKSLSDHEKNELIEAKMRPFFDSQEDSESCEASCLKVHTYESAVLDLSLKGIENIGQTWARLSAEKGLEVGPRNEIRHTVECSQEQWKIPTYEDGVGVDVVVIGPPREWYDHNGFDDSDFYRALERWDLLSLGDQDLFDDPSGTLAHLLGQSRAVVGDFPFNNPCEEKLRIVEERKRRDRLFDSLVANGLLDPDWYYREYHEYSEFFYGPPADLDLPEESTLKFEPNRLHEDDPRRFWTRAQGKPAIQNLREEMQVLILEAFQAGREFERNTVRDSHQAQLKQLTRLRRKGKKAKSSVEIIQCEIAKMVEEGIPLDQIKPKSLKEFVLRESQNQEWREIIENTRHQARKKKGFKEGLGKLEDTSQDPGMNCFKNGLAEYRRTVGKTKDVGRSMESSSRSSPKKKSAKQRKAEKVTKGRSSGES